MNDIDKDRIIEMAWEDRTPFEAIFYQFRISETEVVRLMRVELKPSSYELWRKRVKLKSGLKNAMKRNSEIYRFKSKMQRAISNNKISKRK